jgi:hypothetical protein
MTQDRKTWSEQDSAEVEAVIAPAAIERALAIYQQLQPRDQSVIVQARKNSDAAYLWNGGPRRGGRTPADRRRSRASKGC